MKFAQKLLPFDGLTEKINDEKEKGKTIIQCHGTFDLIHPGHIVHFEEAKELGDVLVVTITAENHVNKGPGRPYFNDELRVKSLINLESIDYVSIVPYPTAVEAIEAVCADIYCKGKEYENPESDVTGNIISDVQTVKKIGGDIAYVGSVVHSSSKLLNNYFNQHGLDTQNLILKLSREFTHHSFKEITDGFSSLKVLVVGDLIFDKYSTVSVQGLTSKNRILSSRLMDESIQAGGALAIFRHIREFTSNVKLFSLAGTESWLEPHLENYLSKEENWIQREPDFTTIVKHRFVEPLSDGKELSKLFSVNHIDRDHPKTSTQARLKSILHKNLNDFDLVLVADFGHGLMSEALREIVQEESSFLALNCQTNSNNYGFNIINRQYERADSFSLDQTEMSLACGQKSFDSTAELEKLALQFNSKYSWFTRGGSETIGYSNESGATLCESLEKTVVDTVGAGDAFCSIASLAATRGLPIELATLMGQISGAIAVRIMGNLECVTKKKFLKSAEALLNY